MPLVSMRELLDHAAANSYGIPAFNVNNLEQVQAVMAAADEVGAPVILQASAGARKYAGENFIKHLIQAAVETWLRDHRWRLRFHGLMGAKPPASLGELEREEAQERKWLKEATVAARRERARQRGQGGGRGAS